MAGVAPPPDAPPPPPAEEGGVVSAQAGFAASPPSASICGFGIPDFTFSFSINLPGFDFALPNFNFALSLKCDLDDPVDAEVSFGGGRTPTGNFAEEDRDY